MNVRKEIYQVLVAEAERRSKQAERDLRENKRKINELMLQQKRLKALRSEAYRIVAELSTKTKQ